jgi:imidazolonepropionase-like amidohydrolase
MGDAEGSYLLMEVESFEHALVLVSDIAGRGGLMVKAYQQGTRQQRQWLARAALETGIGITAHEDATPAVMLPAIIDGITVEHAIVEGALREDIKHFLIESQTPLTPTLLVGAQMRGVISEPGLPDMRQQCLTLDAMVPNRKRLLSSTTGVVATDYADLLNRGARVAIGGHGQSPGVDFHQELELLAIGGATPMNLLRAATMNGAEKLGLESRIGSLVQGKDADFIVLDANPLEDIRNARKIDRVVRRGRTVTWPAGPAPHSWKSSTPWDECQRWNFGLGRSDAPVLN